MYANTDDTLGVILAGGAGTRVGDADKGLLALRERPLVEHVLQRLRPQCDRLLIIANRNIDAYAAQAPTIRDEGTGYAGPLAGLVAVFGFLVANRHGLPRWVLTAPVDCPDPPSDLGTRLRAALAADATACCAFARHAGKAQPLFAMYRIDDDPASWRASADAALHGHGSAMRWHAALEALAVDFDDAGGMLFSNLNTPAEFAGYERMHGTG